MSFIWNESSGARNTNCESWRIEQAVLAERERCAKIADYANPLPLHDWATELAGFYRAKKQIAQKIRSGK